VEFKKRCIADGIRKNITKSCYVSRYKSHAGVTLIATTLTVVRKISNYNFTSVFMANLTSPVWCTGSSNSTFKKGAIETRRTLDPWPLSVFCHKTFPNTRVEKRGRTFSPAHTYLAASRVRLSAPESSPFCNFSTRS
jgi:hypothetical protein